MSQIDKNTVSAVRQLKDSGSIRFHHKENNGLRIMFVGNSITLHGKLSEIGWENNHGMAASCEEKDYVHVLERKILSVCPDATFCICQVADWERQYKDGEKVLPEYEDAKRFNADVLLFRMVENVPQGGYDNELFAEKFEEMIAYLGNGHAKVLVSTSFWHHCGDEGLRTVALKNHYPLVELGDLGENDKNKAIGLFRHEGVANHPGDLGMRRIAERIFLYAQDNDFFN